MICSGFPAGADAVFPSPEFRKGTQTALALKARGIFVPAAGGERRFQTRQVTLPGTCRSTSMDCASVPAGRTGSLPDRCPRSRPVPSRRSWRADCRQRRSASPIRAPPRRCPDRRPAFSGTLITRFASFSRVLRAWYAVCGFLPGDLTRLSSVRAASSRPSPVWTAASGLRRSGLPLPRRQPALLLSLLMPGFLLMVVMMALIWMIPRMMMPRPPDSRAALFRAGEKETVRAGERNALPPGLFLRTLNEKPGASVRRRGKTGGILSSR